MDSSTKSYSSNTQASRDYSSTIRPLLTLETMEYSALISTLQLFLNLEAFFKKICEASPSPTKFSGKIKVI
jgi:hypothetical protein